MAPNSCSFENFENLHFNPFHNESFSNTEDERDLGENFFNELNTEKSGNLFQMHMCHLVFGINCLIS